jgi:hypothetical protein
MYLWLSLRPLEPLVGAIDAADQAPVACVIDGDASALGLAVNKDETESFAILHISSLDQSLSNKPTQGAV